MPETIYTPEEEQYIADAGKEGILLSYERIDDALLTHEWCWVARKGELWSKAPTKELACGNLKKMIHTEQAQGS